MVFIARLANHGGWPAVDEAYRNPPLSTEQILHPEKYRDQIDLPMSIDLGVLKPGDGWKEVCRNVLGEMQMGVMLRKHGAKTAAPGWDGDLEGLSGNSGGRAFGRCPNPRGECRTLVPNV